MPESDGLQVSESMLAPGFKTREHTHVANEATYVAAGGKMRFTLANGSVHIVDLMTGDVRWRSAPETHVAENIGSTQIRLLIIRRREEGSVGPNGGCSHETR